VIGKSRIHVRPVGEAALLLELGLSSSVTTARARALARAVREAGWTGVVDAVPAYRTVLIRWNPLDAAPSEVEDWVRALGRSLPSYAVAAGKVIELAVRYGGEDGPDLARVAAHTGLSPEEVVRRHAGASYTVEFLGFSPGFAYLSGLPPELATPRLAAPRPRVPAGAVGIAGLQTGFYPLVSPGGWQLIGRLDGFSFDPARPETLPYQPGDTIRFIPISVDPGAASDPQPPDGRFGHTVAPADSRQDLSRPTTPQGDERLPAQSRSAVAGGSTPRGLLVVRAGPLSTVQDQGRFELAWLGYATAGALDRHALHLANRLVGNPADAACIELTLDGGEFQAAGDFVVAISGADLDPEVDGQSVCNNRAFWLRDGVRLRFGRRRAGMRAYLAVKGGIATPLVLGSKSTDLIAGIGGVSGRALRAGDLVPVTEPERPAALLVGPAPISSQRPAPDQTADARSPAEPTPEDRMPCSEGPSDGAAVDSEPAVEQRALASPTTNLAGATQQSAMAGFRCDPPKLPATRDIVVRITWGPQADWFSAEARTCFSTSTFAVSPASDRTGLRLSGTPISASVRTDLESEGAVPGVVQVPPDGQPIILLADSRAVGGYAKIATVIGADLSRLAQAAPGMQVRFDPISRDEALVATREAAARVASIPLQPVPELETRCLLEPRHGSATWRCPRNLACAGSRRCNVQRAPTVDA
jgi:KipI family sensor histidine kinase inhibitor